VGNATVQHERLTCDNAPPDASTRYSARISRVVDAPSHHAIMRYPAGRCDLEPQRIGDLPQQWLLGSVTSPRAD
jgi:hypothetical protein